MPVHKIALFGCGAIGRFVYSAGVKNDFDYSELAKIIFEDKGVSLIDIYKKVQQKYKPQKDYFIKAK